MNRYKYLVVRLIILSLVVLMAWIGSGSFLAKTIISEIERVTGGLVNTRGVSTKLSDGRLSFEEFSLVDSNNANRNVLQADSIELEFDQNALWSREFIVTRGNVKNLKLNTPRTEQSQARLAAAAGGENNSLQVPEIEFIRSFDLTHIGEQWTDQFGRVVLEEVKNSELAAEATKAVALRWQTGTNAIQTKLQMLNEDIANSELEFDRTRENPLRNEKDIRLATAKLEETTQKLAAIQLEFNKLSDGCNSDLRQVEAGRDRAVADFENIETPFTLNPGVSSELLTAGLQKEYARQMLEWLRWFRETAPIANSKTFTTSVLKSEILYRGLVPKPNFLIKELQVEGSNHVGGKHFEYAGSIKNLSNQPTLLSEPLTINFRAQGKQHFSVDAEYLFSDEACQETYHITCSDLIAPPSQLGDASHLLVSLGQGDVDGHADISVVGDSIEGSIHVYHQDTALLISQLSNLAGGPEIQDLVNRQLATINSFNLRIDLSGTINAPEIRGETELGDTFDKAMVSAFAEKLQAERAVKQQAMLSRFNDELRKVKNEMAAKTESLSIAIGMQRSTIQNRQAKLPDLNRNSIR